MASGIGETLRATRTQQRLSLAEAAAEIRVREPYLAALEEERFGKLGGDVYVRAFLRGYSEYLGLDPDQVVEAYRREYEGGDEGPRAVAATSAIADPAPGPPPAPVREPGSPPPPLTSAARAGDQRDGVPRDHRGAPLNAVPPVAARRWEDDDDLLDDDPPRSSLLSRSLIGAGVVLLLLVAAVVVVQRIQQRDEVAAESALPIASSAVEIPTPQSVAPSVSPPASAASPAASATTSAQPSVQPSAEPSVQPSAAPPPPSTGPLDEIAVELTVLPAGPSWLRATADGSLVEQDTFQPGTTLSWTAEEELQLRIGDCSKVRLVLNGVDQGLTCGDRETRDITYRIGEPA